MGDSSAGDQRAIFNPAMTAEELVSALRGLCEGKDYMPEDSDELMAIAADRLDDLFSGRSVVVPVDRAHAQMMHLVAVSFLDNSTPPRR